MSDSIIKSFLVKVGFEADSVGLKKFESSIGAAGRVVENLGKTLAVVIPALAYGIDRISGNLEQLYFSAQRTGTSASHLKVLQLAAENLGVSAEEAMGNFEGLAKSIATQPGMAGLLGIRMVDGQGKPTDEKQWFEDLHKRFASMPIYLAEQFAQQAGISYNMMRALRSDDWSAQVAAATKHIGDSFDKPAADAHRFQTQLRNVEIVLERLGYRIFDLIQSRLLPSLTTFGNWLDRNGDHLADRMVEGLTQFGKILATIAPAVAWLSGKFLELDKSTNGWSTKIILGTAALSALGGNGIIGGVLNLAAALLRVATSAGLAQVALVAASGAAGYWVGTKIDEATGASSWIGGKISDLSQWFSKKNDAFVKSSGNLSTRQDWALGKLEQMGWSREQAAGLVANATAESSMDPNAVNETGHRGLFQWDRERWAKFEHFAKTNQLDTADAEAQLKFANYELQFGNETTAGRLLRNAQNAQQAGFVVSHFYERPNSAEEDARRGRMAVTINSPITVHLTGADAKAQLQDLEVVLKRNNERLARTLSSNTR